MSHKPIILFNAYDLQLNPYKSNKIDVQEVVDYCEARFRSILKTLLCTTEEDQVWMLQTLFHELVRTALFIWPQIESAS